MSSFYNIIFKVNYVEATSNEISFTEKELEYINQNQIVFISGNPNLFPIEFYSKNEEKFMGIIPDFFDVITDMSGINFKYINENKYDNRYNLAKDKQVEIISGFEKNVNSIEQYNLLTSKTLMILPNSNREICFAYTSIASPELISIIEKCIDNITHQQKEEIYLKHSIDYSNKNLSYKRVLLSLITISLLMIAVIIIMINIIKNQKKKYNIYYFLKIIINKRE